MEPIPLTIIIRVSGVRVPPKTSKRRVDVSLLVTLAGARIYPRVFRTRDLQAHPSRDEYWHFARGRHSYLRLEVRGCIETSANITAKGQVTIPARPRGAPPARARPAEREPAVSEIRDRLRLSLAESGVRAAA